MTVNIMLIKNMVCHRCILSVEDILTKAAIPFHKVHYGEAHLAIELSDEQKKNLSARLKSVGFELIDSRISELIEKIKILLIKRARNEGDSKDIKLNLSAYLSDQLNYEYTHLSSLFSAAEGRTIENFFIEQRIKKAKELLDCGQMTLSEIALELDYSSTAYLSTQFKKITGITPSYFKELLNAKRIEIKKS
jgi:AraC-like DNA-binding protein